MTCFINFSYSLFRWYVFSSSLFNSSFPTISSYLLLLVHFILPFLLVPLSSPVFHSTAGRKLKNECLAEWLVEDWRGRVSWWEVSMLSLSQSSESLRVLLLPQGGSHLSCFDRRGMQVELPGRKWKRLTKATTSTYFIFGEGEANVTRFQGPSGDWEGGKDPGSTLSQVRKRKLPEDGWVATTHWEGPETHLVLREDGRCTEWGEASAGEVSTHGHRGLCQVTGLGHNVTSLRAESQRLVESEVPTYCEPPRSISKGGIRSLPWYML